EATAVPEVKRLLSRETKLVGTEVFTDTGDKQGKVTDIYFDEASRRVLGLEISSGGMSDIADGRRFLPTDDIVRIGPDVLYIRPYTAETLEQQQGGIKGAVAEKTDQAKTAVGDGTERLKATASQQGDQMRAAGRDGGQAAGGATDRLKGAVGQAKEAVGQATDRAFIGKRTSRDVDGDTGATLIPAGRMVTEDDVARARANGKLGDLATSIGMPDNERQQAGLGDAVGAAGDSAATLWDKFTAKIGEVTDSTGKRMDEQSKKQRLATIEDAVGRPVTKVILDLEDKVILDLGDIITHAAIQRADDAGALDSLLASVYKGDIAFEKSEMKLQRPGEASIENAEGAGVGVPVMEQLRGEVETAEREREAEKDRKRSEADAARQQREREREQNAADRRSRSQQPVAPQQR
ncbi:MAG: PRC-barrel domain-containing protein, partial [Chloroflexota bacterium]